jgi:hypothetical protein
LRALVAARFADEALTPARAAGHRLPRTCGGPSVAARPRFRASMQKGVALDVVECRTANPMLRRYGLIIVSYDRNPDLPCGGWQMLDMFATALIQVSGKQKPDRRLAHPL